MNRRDLLKLGAAAPAAAFGQHAHEFPDFGQLSAPPADANWKPAFFDAHQNETVIVVSELIIPQTDTPGAKAALVNRYMDKIFAVMPEAQQARFRTGFESLEAAAGSAHGKSFVACAADEQIKMLQDLEAKRDPFFGFMKGMTVRIYYATKPGFLELNKGGRVPDTFACKG
jgi:hypothetical protein